MTVVLCVIPGKRNCRECVERILEIYSVYDLRIHFSFTTMKKQFVTVLLVCVFGYVAQHEV